METASRIVTMIFQTRNTTIIYLLEFHFPIAGLHMQALPNILIDEFNHY